MTKPDTNPKKKAPAISDATILEVYVAAAGRCCFCNQSVMVEPLTNRAARLGNIAHIVADSIDGPRGGDPLPIEERSKFANLMLMCTTHHTFIDKRENVPDYPVDRLRHYKAIHEARIKLVTGYPSADKTHALRLLGQIRGHHVSVSDSQIFSAVFDAEKRYTDGDVFDIDLTNIADTADEAYWSVGRKKIDAVLEQRVLPQVESGIVKRLSVFGLSRIPLLCHLGFKLGDKVPLELYQKHRTDDEGWTWPADGKPVRFEVREHGDPASETVAFLASVSGGDVKKVQAASKAGIVYEIHPLDEPPSRMLLRSPATITNFRTAYQEFLSLLEARHRTVGKVGYYLAVPAPVAVVCGRDLLRDVAPPVAVHDLVDDEYRFAFVLK